MPIRVVAVVFTTLQSAVLGTNYSSVAVKLLYVSIIPVFVSERFLKAREIRLILALLENQSDQNSVLLSSIFNLSFFLFSSYVHLSFVYLSSFFIFFFLFLFYYGLISQCETRNPIFCAFVLYKATKKVFRRKYLGSW